MSKITFETKVGIIPHGVRVNQVQDLDMNEIKDVVNANADKLDSFTSGSDFFIDQPNFSILDNVITFTPICRWNINGTIYAHDVNDKIINIQYASTGMTKLAFIYTTTIPNQYYIIYGSESVSAPASPTLPEDSLLVTFMFVFDNYISNPVTYSTLLDYLRKDFQKELIITNTWYGPSTVIFFSQEGTTYRIQALGAGNNLSNTYIVFEAPYEGQEISIKNETGGPFLIKHLETPSGSFIAFSFPTSQDYVIQDEENLKFKYINGVWNYNGTKKSLTSVSVVDVVKHIYAAGAQDFAFPTGSKVISVRLNKIEQDFTDEYTVLGNIVTVLPTLEADDQIVITSII